MRLFVVLFSISGGRKMDEHELASILLSRLWWACCRLMAVGGHPASHKQPVSAGAGLYEFVLERTDGALPSFVKSAHSALGNCHVRWMRFRFTGCWGDAYMLPSYFFASALRIVRQDLGQDVGPRHTGEAAHQPAGGELGPPEGRTMPAQRRGDGHKRSSRRRSWGAAQAWVVGGHAPSGALQRVARNLAAGQRLHADNRLLARRRW